MIAKEIAEKTGSRVGYVRNVIMDLKRPGVLSESDKRYYDSNAETKRAKKSALDRKKRIVTLQTAKNAGVKVPWKTPEIAVLLDEKDNGTPTEEIAIKLRRTHGSTSVALTRFRNFFAEKQKIGL